METTCDMRNDVTRRRHTWAVLTGGGGDQERGVDATAAARRRLLTRFVAAGGALVVASLGLVALARRQREALLARVGVSRSEHLADALGALVAIEAKRHKTKTMDAQAARAGAEIPRRAPREACA